MKRLVLLTLVGLPVLALPAPARADAPIQFPFLPPMRVDAGIKAYFSLTYPGPQGVLPPWYTYFPYDAYFQTPPPTGMYYPNWRAPMTSSAYAPQHAPPAFTSPYAAQPTGVRPVGYYQQAPSYWYGR